MTDGVVQFSIEFTGLDRAFKQLEQRLANRELKVDIDFDTAGFDSRLNQIGSSSSGLLTGIFQGIGQSITNILVNAVGGALRGISGLVQGTVKDFATLEQSIVEFGGRARASVGSVEELNALTEKAADRFRDIGAATSKTPEEVASIATRMIELGGAADQTLESVDDVVAALEATGFTDVDATAKSFQVASTIFGASSEELADKFALLANTTAVTSANDLLQVFSKAGGAAKDLGVEMDELLTIFASFRDAGATPEVAATATRNAIQKLAAPSDKAKAALEELNVSFFDAEGAARQPIEVLGDLDRALQGFSDEQRTGFLTDIFDARSASQLSGILGQLDGRVETTFDNLKNNSEGFAKGSQDALNQGPIAAIVRLQSALNVLSGVFGEAFGAGFESIIRGFTEVIQFINDQDGIFDGLRAGSEALATAFDNINIGDTLAPALTEIIGLISDGIGNALSGIAGFFENNSGAVEGFVTRLVLATEAGLALGNIISQIVGRVVEFGQATGIFERATALAEGMANAVIAFNQQGLSGLIGQFKQFDSSLKNSESVVGQLFGLITGAIRTTINIYEVLAERSKEAFNSPVAQAFLTINNAIASAVKVIASTIASWTTPLEGALTAIGNLNAALEGTTAFSGEVGKSLGDSVGEAQKALEGAFSDVAKNAQDSADDVGRINDDANSDEVQGVKQTEEEKQEIRQKALDEFARAQSQALAAIDQSANSRIANVKSLQISGGIDSGEAEQQIAAIQQDITAQRISAKQNEISEIQQLENEGALSAEESADRILAVQTEIGDLTLQRLDQEIQAQEAAKQAALDKLDAELNAAQQLQEARSIELDIANEALNQQSNLLNAQLGLAQARNQLENNRLKSALDAAQASGDEVAIAQAKDALTKSQIQASRQEFAVKQQQLDIATEQNRIEAQRAIATAEIAALESDIAIQKAQVNGATAEELAVLQRIAQLRAEQVDQARDNAAIQDQISSIEQEQLSVQQQIAEEQLTQQSNAQALKKENNDLIKQAEDLQKLESDRARTVVGALSGPVDFDASAATDQLSQLRQSFQTAQGSGLFQGAGAEINQAFSQVQSAIASGASDSQLIQLAQSDNDFIGQILGEIGRGDITDLVQADSQFNEIGEKLAAANAPVVEELTGIREDLNTLLNEPRQVNLTANTPDSVADVGAMLNAVATADRRRSEV